VIDPRRLRILALAANGVRITAWWHRHAHSTNHWPGVTLSGHGAPILLHQPICSRDNMPDAAANWLGREVSPRRVPRFRRDGQDSRLTG